MVKKKWKNAMAPLDFETVWNNAVEAFRASRISEESKNQMDRYFGQFIKHELSGTDCIITVEQPLQVQWFTDLYSEGLAKALCAYGAPPEVKVVFKAPQDAKTFVPPPPKKETANPQIEAKRRPAKTQYRKTPSTLELDSSYTFENFVCGPSNSFAHATAVAVAKDPGRAYNPLFLWGDTGLGKTHLMQAIGHEVLKRLPGASVCYITSETLLNEYVNALQSSSISEFRNRYRNTDVLLIDDIQFIAGKKQIQEEFFNTFNALLTAHKQIVITCDVAPRDLSGLESRLLSRFQGGMVIEIESPSYETRMAILKSKANFMGRHIPDEALDFIAENIHSHVRALEGALRRVSAVADLNPELELNREQVRRILRDSIENEQVVKKLTISEIQQTVAQHFSVSVKEILSQDRSQPLVTPRQVAMFLARKLTLASLSAVAKEFDKSHPTVYHGIKTIEKRMEVEEQLKAEVFDIVTKLGRRPEDLQS